MALHLCPNNCACSVDCRTQPFLLTSMSCWAQTHMPGASYGRCAHLRMKMNSPTCIPSYRSLIVAHAVVFIVTPPWKRFPCSCNSSEEVPVVLSSTSLQYLSNVLPALFCLSGVGSCMSVRHRVAVLCVRVSVWFVCPCVYVCRTCTHVRQPMRCFAPLSQRMVDVSEERLAKLEEMLLQVRCDSG